jgi:hypothetical protein
MRNTRAGFAPTARTVSGKGPRTRKQVQALRREAIGSAWGKRKRRKVKPTRVALEGLRSRDEVLE